MNAGSDGGLGFDELLERELQWRVGNLRTPSPGADQAAYRAVSAGGKRMPLLSSLTAAASSKAAVGLATAALVVGGGSAAAAAVTGSTDPGTWGKTVTAAVASCKADLASGQHGIGHCVSKIASRKGQEERSSHAASAARMNEPAGTPSAHPTGRPATAPTSHPTGAPTSHPTPHPTGQPSSGGHPTPPVTTPSPR